MNSTSICGYVALVGRPNVGKSTLLNSLIGSKISITSPKPQTTRFQILGIKTQAEVQIVYIDTPGLHQNEKSVMNRHLNRLATAVIPDADLILFVIEAKKWTDEDHFLLSKLKKAKAPVFLVINKIDLLGDKKELLPFVATVKDKFPFSQIIPVSAKCAENLSVLEQQIEKCLPAGPHLFSDEEITDKNLQFQVAEIVREKLIEATEQEVPYCTGVAIESWQVQEKRLEISVLITVEREGQKQIVIGKKGERLKWIGIAARKEIEALLKTKIFLRLWVKVKKHWTDDERLLQQGGV